MTKLTQAGVKSLIKKPGRHGDGQGLFFRVLPGEKGYWVYRFRIAGREREMSLGTWPQMSLAEARDRHAAERAKVRTMKIDPLAERRAGKLMAEAANRAIPTFGQVADEYLSAHEQGWRSDRHRWQWRQTVKEHCAPIRDLPVNEIDVEAVLKALTPLWAKTPVTASRLRGRIETILDAARARGHIPADKANPARWRGQLQHLLPNPKKISAPSHHSAMPWRDVPAFFAKLKASPERPTAMALAFAVLTAMRSKEVRLTPWAEIELDRAIWVIPAERMKMNKEHSVPLSDAAVEILRQQLKARGKSNFVFPGARPAQPLSINALMTALKRMGAGEFTVHGFRSSFRSWCADQGFAFELAEAALAHAPGNAVVQAYQRSAMLERRRPVMAAWADFLDSDAASDKVVAIGSRRTTK